MQVSDHMSDSYETSIKTILTGSPSARVESWASKLAHQTYGMFEHGKAGEVREEILWLPLGAGFRDHTYWTGE